MKRSLLVVVALVACAGVGGVYSVQKGSSSDALMLNKDGTTVETSWLPGWLYGRQSTDYATVIKEAFQQRRRFLTMTVEQDVVRDQQLEVRLLGLPSRARVRVTYHVQYPIGYVLEPGKFAVSGEGNTLVITLERPALIADPAVRLKSYRTVDGGLLIDEQEALLRLQQRIQPEAQNRAPAILARPGIIPTSEAALRGFLRPILASKAAGQQAPNLRFEYR